MVIDADVSEAKGKALGVPAFPEKGADRQAEIAMPGLRK